MQTHMLSKSRSHHAQQAFAEAVRPLVALLYQAYLVVFVLFFGGFSLIGFIKPHQYPFSPEYGFVGAVCGPLSIVGALYFLWSGHKQNICARRVYIEEFQAVRVKGLFSYKAWKERTMQRNLSYATQASFIAGNSFFEVLFTVINPATMWTSVASHAYTST